jgi:hypothetical protein
MRSKRWYWAYLGRCRTHGRLKSGAVGWQNSYGPGRAEIFAPPNSTATTHDGLFLAQFSLSNDVKPTAPATASRLTS